MHSNKGSAPSNDLATGTGDVIFTTTTTRQDASSSGSEMNGPDSRLSPRAVSDLARGRSRTLMDGRRVPDTTSFDWSDLVTVATKAIESEYNLDN